MLPQVAHPENSAATASAVAVLTIRVPCIIRASVSDVTAYASQAAGAPGLLDRDGVER
ncbi:MAG: hypothetical protein BroJett026_27520 [Betaproteobacteria bacterium]|nr:MAG: hypothetical protein BroJett026_27520 [Betaproteobacteria bacterium]